MHRYDDSDKSCAGEKRGIFHSVSDGDSDESFLALLYATALPCLFAKAYAAPAHKDSVCV